MRFHAVVAAAMLGAGLAAAQGDKTAVPERVSPGRRPAAEDLAVPLRELLRRLTPHERADFFTRHEGLRQRLGWREEEGEGGARIYTPEEEKELMEKDPAFRARKLKEQEDLERHIRPAAPLPGARPPATEERSEEVPPQNAVEKRPTEERSEEVPPQNAVEKRPPAARPDTSGEDADKAIKKMDDEKIDLKDDE